MRFLKRHLQDAQSQHLSMFELKATPKSSRCLKDQGSTCTFLWRGLIVVTGLDIADTFGMLGRERQLKRKVADWQLDKNVKGHEMRAIVRKQKRLQLKGKNAAFRVRGLAVPQHKIDRWEKRPDNSHAGFISQAGSSRKLPIR